MLKYQNTKTTKYKMTKCILDKIQSKKYKGAKMQIQQNTKAPKYKYSKIQKYTKQMEQNAKKKYKRTK